MVHTGGQDRPSLSIPMPLETVPGARFPPGKQYALRAATMHFGLVGWLLSFCFCARTSVYVFCCQSLCDEAGKRRGGGVCVYVNRHWCCNITVKEQLYTEHLELLTVALRPYYLPREFNQLFITALYIHLPLTSSWQARVWAESSTGCHRYHRTPPALYWGTSTSAD